MLEVEYIESYGGTWERNVSRISELSISRKIALSLAFACFTGLMAQIAIPLPWTPVPVTGQTFAVLVSGILLGRKWGAISQIMYIGLGVTLIPWFSGWNGEIGVLMGPSGGYLIGFVVAAFFLGHVIGDYKRQVRFFRLLGLLTVANFVIIYGFGLLQLYIWLSVVERSKPDIWGLLVAGAFPFVIGDMLKVIAATSAIYGIMKPKKIRATVI